MTDSAGVHFNRLVRAATRELKALGRRGDDRAYRCQSGPSEEDPSIGLFEGGRTFFHKQEAYRRRKLPTSVTIYIPMLYHLVLFVAIVDGDTHAHVLSQ